jgi:hypothetical protein
VNISLKRLNSFTKGSILAQFIGFSGVGLFVTLLSIGLSYIFLVWLGFPLVYSYLLVNLICIALNARYVFHSALMLYDLFKYYLVYSSGMAIGSMLLMVLKRYLTLHNFVITLLVIPVTLTWNYFLVRKILKGKL